MKAGTTILDLMCVAGLALPGVTVYRRWPDFIYLYAGAAILALVAVGWLIARSPKDVG
jgi:hypothetical protein